MAAKDDFPTGAVSVIPTSYKIAGGDALAPGALEKIFDAQDTIGAWITAQRNMMARSGLDQHRTTLKLPDVDVDYHKAFGQERVTYRPRVSPTIETVGFPPEPEDTPVEFPEYIPPEPPPHPTLLLVVLYKDNHMAGYDMSTLSSKGGQVSAQKLYDVKLQNTHFGTGQIYTCQLSLSGLGVILSGVDFTGKGKYPGKMLIMTNALFDCFGTDGSSASVPIMAGTAQVSKADVTATVYTTVGEYKLDAKNGGWSKIAGTPAHGKPYALAPDGTSYFAGSYYGISVDQPGSAADDKALDDALATLAQDPQWTDKQSPTTFFYTIEGTGDSDDIESKLVITEVPTYVSFITVSAWAGGKWNTTTYRKTDTTSTLTYGSMLATDDPVDVAQTIGAAYWVSGSFGAEPAIHDYKKAIYPGTYPVFDIGQKTLTEKLGEKTATDQSSTLPRATFDLKKPDKPVDVALDQVAATARVTPVASQNPSVPLLPPTATLFGYDNVQPQHTDFTDTLPVDQFGGHYGFTSGGTEDKLEGGHSAFGYFGTTNTKKVKALLGAPPQGFYDSANACLAAAQQFFYQTGGSVSGEQHSEITIHDDFVGHGAFAGADDTTTITQGANTNTLDNVTSFAIKQGGVTVTTSYHGEWSWNGQTGDETKALTYFPWPPGPVNGSNANCYYLKGAALVPQFGNNGDPQPPGTTVPKDYPITTPFKTIMGAAFTPWLHISNSKHYVQGFNISTLADQDAQKRGTFYLFMDDDGGDLMAFLKKDLSCEDSDVVACYMDIPDYVFKQISKIVT